MLHQFQDNRGNIHVCSNIKRDNENLSFSPLQYSSRLTYTNHYILNHGYYSTITNLTRLLRIWRPLRVFGRADCLFLPPLLLLWPDPAPRPSHCCRTGKGRGRGWWGWGRRAGQTGTLTAPLFILPSGLTSCALQAAVIIRASENTARLISQ